ncbi:MAG: ABC transporter ATP-binding protein [Candidatus Rokuibacteriota bacterium]
MRGELLAVHEIHVSYGAVKALEALSLRVDSGEVVAVIGSNGAGKTTLMKAIAGLLRVRGGTIRFEGHEVSKLESHEVVRRGLSLVPEGRQIFGHLTVHENLLLGAFSRKLGKHDPELERCLQIFPRLEERQRQLAGTLSGGEQQMLAIARGLMSRPRLLLIDEPSLGLAPVLVREIFGVIEDLRRHGMTVLIVEQMARLALRVSDRAYVLEHGRIVREGPSGDLLEDQRVLSAYLGAARARRADGS